ncbi:MAG: aldo/keto reductase [Eubacteriales bacterium]|nr:aldo/keto reductase [Eubacteriales bacterium]
MNEYLGQEIPKLGFGFMRLPKLEDGSNDMPQVKEMVDLFMNSGMYYFDTAWIYDGGNSERAIKEALVDRYPRDKFYLATKLQAGSAVLSEEQAKSEFTDSLERTGAGYFDFYLLHAIGPDNYEKYERFHLFEFVQQKKAEGLIKHIGFSFHGNQELLETILEKHPEMEFVQLQINYADWESDNVQSRKVMETAQKYGKGIIIMEPVKGGMLANPPKVAADLLKAADANASYASWAIRFAASQDNIITVLSGMSTLSQVEDNVSYMKDFQPLSEEEMKVVHQARLEIENIPRIACTACKYCVAGCPQKINIPGIFAAHNRSLVWGDEKTAENSYKNITKDAGKASDCIACGQCEMECPQHLNIIELLQECANKYE